MVILEFASSDSLLIWKQENCVDLGSLDAAVLQETCFELPVRLNVNGVELLEFPASATRLSGDKTITPWLTLPVLNVATIGLAKLASGVRGITTLPSV
jgi:hypothetical protein